jgi:flagellar basal body rod protein FlgF
VKKFIHGTALLGVLLFFGCETGTDTVTLEGESWLRDYDKGVKSEAALRDALSDDTIHDIAIVDDITLTDDLTIPEKKKVALLAGNLGTGANKLTVEGSLDVKNGYTLTVTETGGSLVVGNDGSVNVQTGGILWLANADAANDGDTPSAETVLGSSGKVIINGGELRIKTVTADDLESVFGSIKSGLLRVTELVAIKPSDVTNIRTSETRSLRITVSSNEEVDELTIPVGMDLTATGTLSVEEEGRLTVDGRLTVENTLTINIIEGAKYPITGNGVISTGGSGTITFVEDSAADPPVPVSTEYTALGGVKVASIPEAKAAIEASVKANQRNLKDTFFSTAGTSDAVLGIGSVEITVASTPTEVQNTVDGSEGEPVRLTAGTFLNTSPVKASSFAGTDSGTLSDATKFELSISSGRLFVADSDYNAGSEKFAIVTFSNVTLIYGGLSRTVTFDIGVKTSRSS